MNIIRRSISYIYRNFARPISPPHPVKFAGIATCHDRAWSDYLVPRFCLPWDHINDEPSYENALIEGLSITVKKGDRVTVIGGGVGITAVRAWQLSGARVDCYEASSNQARKTIATASRNGANVAVHHAIIGPAIDVYPGHVGRSIALSDLSECDVLEMDCEGAEAFIIDGLPFAPRAIVVETHGSLGCPTTRIRDLLESRGYLVRDLGWAETYLTSLCEKNDVRVLVAIRFC